MPHDLDDWKPGRFGLSAVDDRCGSGDQVYILKAPDNIQVISRGRDKLLVFVPPDGFMVRWALLAWTSELEEGKDPQYQKLAFGYGFSGALREPRHTWLGESDNSGYVFYIKPALLTWAFDQLKTWFDFEEKEA